MALKNHILELNLNDNQLETISGLSFEFPYRVSFSEYAELPGHSIIWHWHEELEIGYIKKGHIKIYTNENSYIFGPGEGYLMNSSIMAMKENLDPDDMAVEVNFIFHSILLSGHYHSIFETEYMNPILKDPHLELIRFSEKTKRGREILWMLKKLEEFEEPEKEKYKEFHIRNYLSGIWIHLLDQLAEAPKTNQKGGRASQSRLQYMIAYIHEHFADKITLEDIADSASISTREATRCFKRIRGKSPVDYLIEYRLGRAQLLLRDTDESITDIALQTGFSDSAYFGKMFKRYFHITPGEFRKNNE